ncbi:glycosyltransferase [Aquipuribacter sp. SD81]|uniref:glycosyltransferase n=1 Tax=Aquipuribacter sp. SD81 TaxID=3127703 RepID=UPI0030165E7F
MRVTVVAISDPWESAHGGTLRTRALARGLLEAGDDVVCLFPAGEASSRTEAGVRLVGVATATTGGRRWPGPVRALKRALLPMPTEAGARSRTLLDAVTAERPDVVVVSQLPYAWYAEQAGVPLWLDHSDLWSDFIGREVAARRGVARLTARRQQRGLEVTETRRSRDAVVTTAAGWVDATTLGARTGRDVGWLPTPVGEGVTAARPVAGDRPTAGFLANFGFWPNVDALRLLDDVWAPRLLADGWRVVVAGLESDRMQVRPGVEVLGPLADVADFYDRVDVTLAPIRLGGGMKVKVVESMLRGRPVVSTALGVEGFPPKVRRLAHVVDAQAPAFPAPAGLAAPLADAAPETLAPFTTTGFTATVADLRERILR